MNGPDSTDALVPAARHAATAPPLHHQASSHPSTAARPQDAAPSSRPAAPVPSHSRTSSVTLYRQQGLAYGSRRPATSAATGAASFSATGAQPPGRQPDADSTVSVPDTRTGGAPPTGPGAPAGAGQWFQAVAQQTSHGMRQRMMLASDQLGHSLRQFYASASSIAGVAGDLAAQPPPSYHNIPGIVPYYVGRSSGPPPSYDDVMNPYAPPPTYQSLFGQMREARKSSRGLLDLSRRLLVILVSTLGCTLLIAFMVLIPFTMIIVGATYIDECRVEHIPAFLLVGGLVWAAKNVLHCYAQCQMDDERAAAAVVVTGSLSGSPNLARRQPTDELASPTVSTSSSAASGTSSSQIMAPNANATSSSSSPDASSSLSPAGIDLDLELGLGSASATAASAGIPSASGTLLRQGSGGSSSRSANANGDATRAGSHRGRHPRHPRHHSHHRRQHAHHHPHPHQHQHQHHHLGTAHQARRLKSSICESLLSCILFGWFIAGCVIVFRNYEPEFDNSQSARYCNRTVYMYTFWLISSALAVFSLFIGSICCLMVSSAIASRQEDDLS